MCVAHVMLPKAENDIEPDLWPMYGTPEAILVDNGKVIAGWQGEMATLKSLA